MDMHTFKDRTIDTEKLEVMVDDKGNPMTMFEVYKNMAKYYKKENPDKKMPVRVSESYDYNEKTGEWEVIGYNYSEDYITTLTEREKGKDKEREFSEEKFDNNYDQKIEEVVERFESKRKEEKEQQEKVKDEIEEYMKNLNDKVKNLNNTQKHDKDLDR